jgi:hypothetical protein
VLFKDHANIRSSGYVFERKCDCYGIANYSQDLHEAKYYPVEYSPDEKNVDRTPEARCIYEDFTSEDYGRKHDSCRRLYFKAMSKAMAMECSGEVYVMTTANLRRKEEFPEDGIWWETEFPTLIDGGRSDDKQVTKVSISLSLFSLAPENFFVNGHH